MNTDIKASPKDQLIELLQSYDFAHVADVMKKLNWIWHPILKVPNEMEIKDAACKLLKDVVDAAEEDPEFDNFMATGGFTAQWCGNSKSLQLFFSIESYR